jgi:hypothetical protein
MTLRKRWRRWRAAISPARGNYDYRD